jgi:hypothetical protein
MERWVEILYCTVQYKRMDGIGEGKKEVWRGE